LVHTNIVKRFLSADLEDESLFNLNTNAVELAENNPDTQTEKPKGIVMHNYIFTFFILTGSKFYSF